LQSFKRFLFELNQRVANVIAVGGGMSGKNLIDSGAQPSRPALGISRILGSRALSHAAWHFKCSSEFFTHIFRDPARVAPLRFGKYLSWSHDRDRKQLPCAREFLTENGCAWVVCRTFRDALTAISTWEMA
jgi:GrpB-like predicted nucleotidyltransferase (UPF0157 family)